MKGEVVSISVAKVNFFLDEIIIFLTSLILLIDIANGFLLFNNVVLPLSISQIYKVVILGLMFFRIFSSFNKSAQLIVLFLILIFAIIIYVHFVRHPNFSFLKQDIEIVLKLLLVPISYFYFCILHAKRPSTFKKDADKNIFL